MAGSASVEEMVCALHEALQTTAWAESELTAEDVAEVLVVFCRFRKLLRVLLTLCDD